MHTILFSIQNGLILRFLSGISVLNTVILLVTQSHLSIAQASSFKCLNTHTFTYGTLTFITEAHYLVTQVQLLLMTVTVN